MIFSVIIPCYNHAQYLDEALLSVIHQTYTDWEAIILNDGSTDNTAEIADKWCKKDTRIKLISTANNGLSSARNIGVEFSRGEYISLLDADDKFAPNHLQSFFDVLSNDFDIVFSGYTYFNSLNPSCHTVYLNKQVSFEQILKGNIVPPVSVAFRKYFLNLTGGFDTTLKSAEDWDLWIRFYKVGGRLGISETPTSFYRITNNSMSRQYAVMYQSLKQVYNQANTIDHRISNKFVLNKTYNDYSKEPIKKFLLMCLGVAIIQNKISEGITLFKKDSEEFCFSYKTADFRFMCSHLSFRYYDSRKEMKWVLDTLKPLFINFFQSLDWPDLDVKNTISEIFSIHIKKQVRYKWGILSPLINRIS